MDAADHGLALLDLSSGVDRSSARGPSLGCLGDSSDRWVKLEEGTFMGFRIAYQGRDFMRAEESIREDPRLREAS